MRIESSSPRAAAGVRTASLCVAAALAPAVARTAVEAAAGVDPGVAWSIFNHRAADWFIFFWGLTALIDGLQWPNRTWWRFVPPLVLQRRAQRQCAFRR